MKSRKWLHLAAIVAMFILIGVVHYAEQMGLPATAQPSWHFGLTRHSLDRLFFLFPILYACYMWGQPAGLISCGAAVIIMLPRAVLFSPAPADAILEIAGITALSVVAVLWISSRTRQKEKFRLALAELESAHQLLQRYVRSARDNERRLTLLNTILNVLTRSLELDSILNKAVHLVMELMDVEVVLIYSLNETAHELSLIAHEGVSEEFVRSVSRIKEGEQVSGKAARLGQPVLTDATREAVTPELKKMNIESELAVPLMLREQVRGVLYVAMRRPRQFLPPEIEILSVVSAQMAATLENARLYQSERMTTQRLAISERNYRELFEKANDAIWVHDLTGKIIFANSASARLTGYSLDELHRMNARGFLSDAGLNIAAQVRRNLIENQPAIQPYEQRLLKKDGTEAILMLTTSLVTEAGEHIAFHHIARDITQERRLQDNLRYYLNRVTEVQEEERKRVARELHDDTSQALYAILRQVDNFTRSQPDLAPKEVTFLKELRERVNEAQEGVRRFSHALRPPMLDDLGLIPTVRWLVDDMKALMTTEIKVKISGNERRASPEIELTLFRAVQEALNNVWKHARASQAEINIKFMDEKIEINVSDNGIGFTPLDEISSLPRKGRMGLTGIEERVHLLGGSLTVHSQPGKGTQLTVETPIKT